MKRERLPLKWNLLKFKESYQHKTFCSQGGMHLLNHLPAILNPFICT